MTIGVRALMTVADLIVEQLRGAGARALFGVPGGGGNLDLIGAADRAGLPFVLVSTETAGAIAALAQAEVTGGIGACLTTLGPGAASVVNGAACAFLERAPIVVFTDSQPAMFEHQRLDHTALLRPIVKWSDTLVADKASQIVARAIHEATAGRPGPVHLDCPAGVAGSQPPPQDACFSFEMEESSARDREELERLVGAARRPLVIAGIGARRAEDAAAVRGLCARRRIPAMVTYKGKGIVADGDAWFAGVFTNAAIEQAVIDESDLVIGIGLDPVELLPRAWKNKPPIVLCNPWSVDGAHVPFAARLIAPVAWSVQLIEHAVPESAWDAQQVRAMVDAQRQQIRVPAEGLTAQRVVETAAARLAGSCGRVTVDAGAHMLPATMLWPVGAPNGMLISNGLSTMGFALPAAIGAALLDRSKPTVALTGDGGLLMCAGELLTAAREHLPVVTIVFNDASLSLIELKQQARALPAGGVALGAVDWAKMAESVGLAAWTAADEASLDRAVAEAAAHGGPSLVDARIDRSNYGAVLRAVRG
jgi:acetolactate synthase-1/2/3 large subunit